MANCLLNSQLTGHAALTSGYKSVMRREQLQAMNYRRNFECSATAEDLRRILDSPGVHLGPACHDALSAKLVQNAGFSFTFMSGFAVSVARLACPDTGLISYGEMVDQGRNITSAVSIPIIGDGDTGYGNAMNVKRTVKGYMQAGFAGILLEDQVSPKACGHTRGRKVVGRNEAVARIRAAVDARNEAGGDIVIVARTDSRQATSLEEALWRTNAFADAGADVLFVDALASVDEMRAFCQTSASVPKMANMLEGGGKTPILSPIELEQLGFKIVAYPLSLIGVSIRAMQDALVALKGGRLPTRLPSFEEIKDIAGFNAYYDEESRYITDSDSDAFSTRNETSNIITPEVVEEGDRESTKNSSSSNSLSGLWSRAVRVKVTASSGIVKLDVRIPAGFVDGISKIIPGVSGMNLKDMLDDAAAANNTNQELIDIIDKQGDRIQITIE